MNTLRQYTPDLAGWFTKFGPGRRVTTTPTATTRASSRSSARSASTTSTNAADTEARRAAPRRVPAAASSAAARAGRCRPPPDGSAPFVVAGCSPESNPDSRSRLMRRLITVAALCAGAPAGRARRAGRGRRRRAATRCGRSSTTWPRRCPGEDVKVAGAKVGVIESMDVTERQEGRGRPADRRRPLHAVPRGRQVHRPAAVADRREVRGVRARAPAAQPELTEIEEGDGEGAAPAAGRRAPARRWTSTW